MNKKIIEKLETDIIHILKNIDYKEKGRNGVGYDFWKLKEIVTEKFNKLKGVTNGR
jgi:NADH/NAD ratio-sensing transcriptional regulator Rex